MKSFLDLADFTREEIVELLAFAEHLRAHPQPQALAGRILGLVLLNPSLRTLSSFQAGMARLGGTSFVITPGHGTWQLESRLGVTMNGAAAEHVREGIPVLASYCDVLGIRAFADGRSSLQHDLDEVTFNSMAGLVDRPLINLESAMNHPCQALADLYTLKELVGRLKGHTLAYIGDGNNVARSLAEGCGRTGMKFVMATPKGYQFDAAFLATLKRDMPELELKVTTDPAEAVRGATAIYTDVWTSMGQENESQQRRQDFAGYQVNARLLEGGAGKSGDIRYA